MAAAHNSSFLTKHAKQNKTDEVDAVLSKRYGHVNLFVVVMLILAAAIIYTGVKISLLVQQYHQDFRILQDLQKQQRTLQIEEQRLIIEQQTFSATPQIASRAVTELGMFTPSIDDKLILQPQAPSTSNANFVANAASTATDYALTDNAIAHETISAVQSNANTVAAP